MPDIQLGVRDIHKTFDPGLFEAKIQVLKGLSFEVRRGEIFGFLGPNGAGKTTTIKAIAGLIILDAGEITICGLPHTSLQARRRLGFMAESPYFYQHLTGREFLRFHAGLLGLAAAEARLRIDDLLDRVGMSAAADAKMHTFSKGMLQRVSLAQALLGEPELLLLDEPMSGLDPVGRREVRDIIVEERARGTTIFFSSHIIPDVEALCDRVAIVFDGRVRATGSVRDLVAQEVDHYEVTFAGADLEGLAAPVVASHAGSDASWVRVGAEHRDQLVRELSSAGARLISVNPVRSSLEDLIVGHYREARQ